MGGVDVTVDVGLEGGVHGDKAETAHHLGAVGYFTGAHEHLVAEEVDVLHEMKHGIIAEGKRTSGGEAAFAFLHERHHRILDNLGVHLEAGNLRILSQTVEHGVGHVAHTGLDGEEFLGDLALAELVHKEAADIVADTLCQFIGSREGLDTLGCVGGNHADNLLGIDFQHGASDAVRRPVDGNLAAVRGIERNIVVVESAERVVIVARIFDDNLLGHLRDGRGHAQTGSEDHISVGAHLGDLDDGHVDIAVKAITQILRKVAQMGVEVIDAVTGAVDKRTAIFMTLVGGAPCDGIRSGELTVNMVVRRCACEKVDLERFPFFMEGSGSLSQCHRYYFRRS